MKKPIFFSLIITVAMLSLIISCADRLDTYDIIQTTTTEQKLDNDAGTATAIAERKVSMDATAAVMAIKEDLVPPTINHFTDDPALDSKLNFTFNKAQKRTVRAAISNTFGFGGHNASVLFKKSPSE